jgi:transmembrane sensor
MTNEYSLIADLLVRHLTDDLTEEERRMLDHWLAADEEHARLMADMEDKSWLNDRLLEYMAVDERASWDKIRAQIPSLASMKYDGTRVSRWHPFFRSRAAVWALLAGLAIVGAGSYIAVRLYHTLPGQMASTPGALVPAKSQAALLYTGSSTIALQDYTPGWRDRKGNMEISMLEEGVIKVSIHELSRGFDNGRLTLQTPVGGKYRMILPDSTTIDLNAASSVELTGSFNRQRIVWLQGEGYFEVHPQPDEQPFTVRVSDLLTITAVGTIFDVKAYPEDSHIQASLLSGHITVQQGADPVGQRLTAGQAYIIGKDGAGTIQALDDTANAVSLKNGTFDFTAQPITDILQELSRWYKADLEYKELPSGKFDLYGLRSEPLGNLLRRLERTGHLHFTVHQHKVIISLNHH